LRLEKVEDELLGEKTWPMRREAMETVSDELEDRWQWCGA